MKRTVSNDNFSFIFDFMEDIKKVSVEKAIKKANEKIMNIYEEYLCVNLNDTDSDIAELYSNSFDNFVDEMITFTEYIVKNYADELNKMHKRIERGLSAESKADKVIDFQTVMKSKNKTKDIFESPYNFTEYTGLEFLDLYGELSLTLWVMQNSALKRESIDKQCRKLTEKITLMLKENDVIVNAIDNSGEIKGISFKRIGEISDYSSREEYMEAYEYVKNYINDFLYAVAKDYVNGAFFVHEVLINNPFYNEREYGFELIDSKYYTLSVTDLSIADENTPGVKYEEIHLEGDK